MDVVMTRALRLKGKVDLERFESLKLGKKINLFICLKTYFLFEMMTYLLVTPIIFFFCMADTTFALKRSEESGA